MAADQKELQKEGEHYIVWWAWQQRCLLCLRGLGTAVPRTGHSLKTNRLLGWASGGSWTEQVGTASSADLDRVAGGATTRLVDKTSAAGFLEALPEPDISEHGAAAAAGMGEQSAVPLIIPTPGVTEDAAVVCTKCRMHVAKQDHGDLIAQEAEGETAALEACLLGNAAERPLRQDQSSLRVGLEELVRQGHWDPHPDLQEALP
ncbi:MAG: hypothetical protein FRX49_03015 [Trebouxia sp. A1-2]|nr:MAG: hypothetical protein FRX49_03015 [Trebouxia sp. A1-2]